MANKDIYSKEWCDQIFEGKNKKYGAYVIRTSSERRHLTALLIVVFTLLLFVALPFILQLILSHSKGSKINIQELLKRNEGIVIKEANYMPERTITSPSDNEEVKKPPTEQQIAKDIVATEKPRLDWGKKLAGYTDGTQHFEMELTEMDTLRIDASMDNVKQNEQITGTVIDSLPQFPGGIVALVRWLDSNTKYPAVCIREKIEGTVEVEFSVNPDGRVSDPVLKTKAHRILDDEVLRAIKKMPRWIPPKRHPMKKPLRVNIPIIYQLK